MPPQETAAEEEDIGELTRREAERRRAAEEASVASPTTLDGYCYNFGQNMKLTGSVLKTTFKVAGTAAVVGGAGYLGFLAFGIDAPILAGGLIAGDGISKIKNKEPISYKDIMVKGIAGAVLGGFLHYAFPAVHYVGDHAASFVSGAGASSFYTTATSVATKTGAFIGVVFPGFIYLENNVLYPALDSEREPFTGKEFMGAWGKATAYIGLLAALNINYVPVKYQTTGAAVMSTVYGFASAKPKEAQQNSTATAPVTNSVHN